MDVVEALNAAELAGPIGPGLEAGVVEHLEGGELTVTLWRGAKYRLPQRQRRAA